MIAVTPGQFDEGITIAHAGARQGGRILAAMRLSPEEMELFEASCRDAENVHAQELMNVFGAERALDVLNRMPGIPLGLLIDVVSHLWRAMNHEMRRRGGQFTPSLESET